MVNKLSYSTALIQNELNFEMGALKQTPVQETTSFTNSKFTNLVIDLQKYVTKAFRADFARVIFVPVAHIMQGIYLDWMKQLQGVNLEGSLATTILRN